MFSWRNFAFAMFDRAYYADGGVFHIWGHSWEIEKYKMWDELKNVLEYISKHNGVDYLTNGQIIKNKINSKFKT